MCNSITHDWKNDCEKCAKCGITRENQHDWSKDCERCSLCNKFRSAFHNWVGSTCTNCNKKLYNLNLRPHEYLNSSDIELINKTVLGHIDEYAIAQLLYKIHRNSELFFYRNPQTNSHLDSDGRNKVAVLIGESLDNKGGIELMESVAKRFPDQYKVYLLSHSWDRIGSWFA